MVPITNTDSSESTAAAATTVTGSNKRPFADVDGDDGGEHAKRTMDQTQEDISKEKFIDYILEDLASQDEETLERALDQIWMYLGGDESVKLFFRVGGHSAVVRVMKEQMSSENIQYQGMRILSDATDENPQGCAALSEIKGKDATLSTMKHFPASGVIVHLGFTILYKLCNNDDAIMNLAGDIPFLLECMKAFQSNEPSYYWIAHCGSSLLVKLTGVVKLDQSVANKAIRVLGFIIGVWDDDCESSISKNAREALKNLL